jgi:hypothetical protein
MAIRHPTHQAAKSCRDFFPRLPKLLIQKDVTVPSLPLLPLVLRVGLAGHLAISDPATLTAALNAVFVALRKYVEDTNPTFRGRLFADNVPVPRVQLRLVSQLASGADQLAANAALHNGYALHVVLPGNRDEVEQDVQRNAPVEDPTTSGDSEGSATLGFRSLLAKAERVLELDHTDYAGQHARFTANHYAQAGSIILCHCDLLLIAIHPGASAHPGGTRWMEQQAEEQDLPIIRIPLDQPEQALLIWTEDTRRESRNLFDVTVGAINPKVFETALEKNLLGPTVSTEALVLGKFESRMIALLDLQMNEAFWNQRWVLPGASTALPQHALGTVPEQVDAAFKHVKILADRHASAMAELVRGSFIFCALLGVAAVLGALVGLVLPCAQSWGEAIELSCLFIILWFIWRSKRYRWRSNWLSFRQLERMIDQAAWLMLLGRCREYSVPAHVAQFQTDEIAMWTNTYYRALMRSRSFPTASLGVDYRNTVHALVSHNLVAGQISYFDGESEFQVRSDEVLECATWWVVWLAICITGLYLLWHASLCVLEFTKPGWAPAPKMESLSHCLLGARTWVIFFGALLPAVAAAISSVRGHGEYLQLATRFQGAAAALREIQVQMTRRLQDRRFEANAVAPRSAWLARLIASATEVLADEVMTWRAIFQKKNIEPS